MLSIPGLFPVDSLFIADIISDLVMGGIGGSSSVGSLDRHKVLREISPSFFIAMKNCLSGGRLEILSRSSLS